MTPTRRKRGGLYSSGLSIYEVQFSDGTNVKGDMCQDLFVKGK